MAISPQWLVAPTPRVVPTCRSLLGLKTQALCLCYTASPEASASPTGELATREEHIWVSGMNPKPTWRLWVSIVFLAPPLKFYWVSLPRSPEPSVAGQVKAKG